jgi:hypothetical protein
MRKVTGRRPTVRRRLMARKYRLDLLFIKPFRSVQATLHRRQPRGTPVVLDITPSLPLPHGSR